MKAMVAVITPTKNRLKLLCETMDSVQRQSFDAWEHIIVDDGSDDGTAEEVMRRAEADPRIRYLKRTGDKPGANVCRNIGIRESRADLIVFLDSDDILRPQCLERRVAIMQRNQDLHFAVFRAGVFAESVGDLGRLYHSLNPGDDLSRFLALECVWEISGPIWRRSFLEKIGCFDEGLLSMQDVEMHVRAIAAHAVYIRFADLDHDIRGQEDSSKTSARHFRDPRYIRAVERIPARLLAVIKNGSLLTWSRQRALVGRCFGAAESWVQSGRLDQAVRAWNEGCHQQQVPWHVWMMGLLMLCTARLSSSQDDVCSRLVNKWKGWVRFRQEPALVEQEKTAVLCNSR